MENVVLIIHLILALCLIAVVLLQRSEGGGLGMGGGGGGGVSSRGGFTGLHKLTWAFAIAFIATSITLTIFAAQNSASTSVIDRLGIDAADGDVSPLLPPDGTLLPPPAEGDPLVPPPVE